MKHYICTGGCGGLSDKPGVCQEETCPKHGMPLTECGCTDGKHEEAAAGVELELELSEGEEKGEKEKSEEQIKKVSETISGMLFGGVGLFIAGAVVGGILGGSAGALLCQNPTITSSPVTSSPQVTGTPTSVPTSDPRVTSTSAETVGTPSATTDSSVPSTTTPSSDGSAQSTP